MSMQSGRYPDRRPPTVADDVQIDWLTPPSRLYGANGLRTGPDGRIYVAQVTGSQISALSLQTGELQTISARGGEIIAPDDLAFDPRGNLYATEVMDGRVSVQGVDGQVSVLRDDLPCANGITVHQGRLFISECRIGGRILELDLGGGPPRVLLEDVPMPNAMEVGPDGLLYFPVMGTQEIWRIHPDGGSHERVAADLGVPDAVKFDSQGFIVSTQVATGEVLRIDPRSGERTVLASLSPGLDNLTFVGERLFVSQFSGEITEILPDGGTRALLPGGLNWPLDLTVCGDGTLVIADGTYLYALRSGGQLQTLGMLMSPGYPGFIRGVVASGAGEFIVTTSNGQVSRYRPGSSESEVLADGLDQLYGLALAPDGAVVTAELGTGRVLSIRAAEVTVLASGLREPCGVTCAEGECWVSESGAGRVVRLSSGGAETVLDGLQRPQGIVVHDGLLYVLDAGDKSLICADLKRGGSTRLAEHLPVGAPPGVVPKPLRGMPPFSGPQGPFAGIAIGPEGRIYLSADGAGAVLELQRSQV